MKKALCVGIAGITGLSFVVSLPAADPAAASPSASPRAPAAQQEEATPDALFAKVQELSKALHDWGAENQPKFADSATSQEEKQKLTAEYQRRNEELVDAVRAFAKKSSEDDPRHWVAVVKLLGKDSQAEALAAFQDILKSDKASPEAKFNAILFMNRPGAPQAGADAAAAYLKEHPDMPGREALELYRVQALEQSAPGQADTLLKTLAADSNPKVAAAAKDEQASLAARRDLKVKPLDLKFTAVDGREVDTAKLRGKVVLIDFWATWCGPCVGEVPNVVSAYKKYHDRGFEIVGISLDQDKGSLEKFVSEKQMTWPQYFDGKVWKNAISSRYGIDSIPRMWLLGKDGKVASFDARADLDGEIAKLVDNKPAETSQTPATTGALRAGPYGFAAARMLHGERISWDFFPPALTLQ